ncbi:glucan biosynthesis protein [Solimonas marina]|uniref:Glucans biosynthesis protein D n=1 Tax=Solimonas marina TaxID=2714601 RepID=A0A969WB96_9GAMM|nr:glucan biosynthesis protein D [Solimonas marina]NKF22306.1 glucan biosynthesis protein D [Solimonas marina]
MNRRELLKSTAALTATALPSLSAFLSLRADADELKPLGHPHPFDYAKLKGRARAMAGKPWQPPPTTLPKPIAGLDWDRWQSIRFRDGHSLWRDEHLDFQARFFHLGFTVRTPVHLFEVVDGRATEIAYDSAMFDYGKSGVKPGSLPADLGFAGFRLYYGDDFQRDVAAFQGASYFRAVGGEKQYGQSARGLAVDCGLPRPEEFPTFVAYWLERPAAGATSVTVYGLLDSASVTGAYRFILTPGDSFVMDIDTALYLRKPIERIGIAPLTSMFECGENDRRVAHDWRPEIHDTDGLQIWNGRGEWIWRPLVNPSAVHVNSFFDDNPHGFGLMQRDRNFDHYQDDGVFYDRRPSVWVEPKEDWGPGVVMLVEIPTADETSDNIVAFWKPKDPLQPGQEYRYAYRLSWGAHPPYQPPLGTTRATRTGLGGVVGQPRRYFSWRFAVDFAGGPLTDLPRDAKVEAVIEPSRGRVEIVSARPLDAINGWRAMFDLVPDDSSEPIDIRLYLRLDGKPLTETWLYQYTPPPVDQRQL